jgi:hypothetical protein
MIFKYDTAHFDQAAKDLVTSCERLLKLIADTQSIREKVREEFLAITQDMVAIGRLLINHAIECGTARTLSFDILFSSEFQNDYDNKQKLEHSEKVARLESSLAALIRSFMFLLRAAQDCIYRIMLDHAAGEIAGEDSSISKKIDETSLTFNGATSSATGRVLNQHIPEYPTWFTEMRNLRNCLKRGTNFCIESIHVLGPSHDKIGISFSEGLLNMEHASRVERDSRLPKREISLDYFIEAYSKTKSLIDTVSIFIEKETGKKQGQVHSHVTTM